MPARGITRITHVDLRVRKLNKSVDFYADLFQLSVRSTQPPSELSRQCLACQEGPDGGFGFVLTQGLSPGSQPGGVDHIGLEVPTLQDVVCLYRKAMAMKARATEPRIYEGHWQFFVFDPDGYKLEITAAQLPADSDQPDQGEQPAASSTGAPIR